MRQWCTAPCFSTAGPPGFAAGSIGHYVPDTLLLYNSAPEYHLIAMRSHIDVTIPGDELYAVGRLISLHTPRTLVPLFFFSFLLLEPPKVACLLDRWIY